MTSVISSPGKVLMAGGYLVLDPEFRGLVIATPSRFYTVIKSTIPPPSFSNIKHKIIVHSPQFLDGVWEYEVYQKEGEWKVDWIPTNEIKPNSFVHLSLSSTLLLAAATSSIALQPSLSITIVGSNDFYSQSRSEDHVAIPFAPLGVKLRDVHKTGLGSSAAMVTSLSSALYLHLISPNSSSIASIEHDPSIQQKTLMHNLAQYVHSLAQGKVGSGFDVSSACFGSQVYRRFKEECFMDFLKDDKISTSSSLFEVLSPSRNALWLDSNGETIIPEKLSLPPWTTLILADVDTGSNTPSMVSGVLKWKKADPIVANQLWSELNQQNELLRENFDELTLSSKLDEMDYFQQVQAFSALESTNWDSDSPFTKAKSTILSIRKHLRKMGELSNIPIEPPSQTKLLDAISVLPGVIGAGVPGAGGYDAIWILLLTPPSSGAALNNVLKLIENWSEMSVKVLSRSAWAVGGEREGKQGLVIENLNEVEGLREVVV